VFGNTKMENSTIHKCNAMRAALVAVEKSLKSVATIGRFK